MALHFEELCMQGKKRHKLRAQCMDARRAAEFSYLYCQEEEELKTGSGEVHSRSSTCVHQRLSKASDPK